MDTDTCPFCKEEIKIEAILCKHCHSPLKVSPAERILYLYRWVTPILPPLSTPSLSPCKGLCYAKFKDDKSGLKQCLRECEAEAATAIIMAKLQRELDLTFEDIIWGGGDIDPKPFEREVRKRFSNPRE